MKKTLMITTLAAALMGSGVANAAGTLYPGDYKGGSITLGSDVDYDTLIVNEPLTLTGSDGYLTLANGATLAFSKKNEAESICSISTSGEITAVSVCFFDAGDVYNFTFDGDAQAIVAASAGKPITLIEDLSSSSYGFAFGVWPPIGPSDTTLKLNGVESGNPVEMNGVQFTYVGPKESDYVFKAGEIGFTGYEEASHALNLVAKAPAVPEPTTGTLSLLALAGLCIRRRK